MLDQLTKKLGDVRENELMANHTTFKIGGPAKFYYRAKNSQQLLKAVKAAESFALPYAIIGWGSNILVADAGYDGLVIQNSSDNFVIEGNEITADAGLNLSRLVGVATQAGLSGLEFCAGIPGTVGGATAGNAGAYGQSFGQLVKMVKIYDQGKIKKISREKMNFSYRDSAYKHSSAVILSVTIGLEPASSESIRVKVMATISGRKKLPTEPSAGCIFKNIELNKIEYDREKILRVLEISEAEWKKITSRGKLSVGYVIERLGLKNETIGGCRISDKHCAFFINTGQCTAEQVMMLISAIKMKVRNKLGLQLQEEIKYLGF